MTNFLLDHIKSLLLGGSGTLLTILLILFKDAIREAVRDWIVEREKSNQDKYRRTPRGRMDAFAYEVLDILKERMKKDDSRDERMLDLLGRMTVANEVGIKVQDGIHSELGIIKRRLDRIAGHNGYSGEGTS